MGDWERVQRRQTVRHPVEMRPTSVQLLDPERGPVALSAVMTDLSAGGMRLHFATSVAPQSGDQLELTFGTPSGGAELRLRVTVVRVVAPIVGCEFVEPSA